MMDLQGSRNDRQEKMALTKMQLRGFVLSLSLSQCEKEKGREDERNGRKKDDARMNESPSPLGFCFSVFVV